MNFDLRTARINAGLSQRELAAEVGVPYVTIQNLENGRGARPSNAKKIADHFDIKVTDLLPAEQSRAA
jgi:DNA-binding XRE family transcriptional regulator